MTIFQNKLEKELKQQLKTEIQLELPPNKDFGDLALPCFKLKRSPSEIQKQLKLPNFIEKTEIKGPYLNFFIKKSVKSREIISEIIKKQEKYGSQPKKQLKVMIEFSQPNTHKAFHVGHIRGTSLGESIARILEFTGYKVIRANYQGDTGMHVAKWLWCYLKYHKNETPHKDKASWIAGIYVEAVKKLENNQEGEEEVKALNLKIDKRDKSILSIWKKSRKWSLDEFEKIYKDLNTRFDYYFFEHDMEEEAKKLSNLLIKENIAKISEGASIIDMEKYGLSVWVLLRSDGTVLYSAKDLVLAKKKFEKYKINKSIYIVGAAQSLHFRQAFKTLELMGFKYWKDCLHIPFSEVRLPTGKMSSRTGENILYQEMLKELTDYLMKETKERHKEWSQAKIEKTAKNIALAAIKFTMLSQDPNKIITFNSKEATDFQGESGPYVQYAYARSSSILKKAKFSTKDINKNLNHLITLPEQNLIDSLSQFPERIDSSSNQLKPHIIANYLISLSKSFTEFYHSCPTLKATPKLRQARLNLVKATNIVLKQGLNLLGIDSPQEM